jgi:lipopolysaccharide export system protein LptA
MSAQLGRGRAAALIIAALVSATGLAAAKTVSSTPVLPGANSKEPISIEADKLNYFDKEQKAVYTGNVVVIQGDSKLTCSVLTIFLAKTDSASAAAPGSAAGAAATPASAPGAAPGAAATPAAPVGPTPGGNQVKHMEAAGPVTLISKTQVATGDRGTYDKEQNKVWLFDHVTMSDGGNVTEGDKLTYDMTTGEAVVEVHKTGRVKGVFEQGAASPDAAGADKSTGPKKDAADKKTTKKNKVPGDNSASKQ